MARVIIVLIRGYQRVASPWLGSRCKYYPSCSEYGAQAVAKFGILRGLVLAGWRLVNPRRSAGPQAARASIDAATAERLGLINAIFPIADFDARADEWLQRLYKQSASSLRFAKRAFRLAQSADFDERLAAVERLYLDELMATDDANEGLIAFTEKRKPVWSGK